MSKKPTVLMILDGYGLNDKCEANAVCEGKTPVMAGIGGQDRSIVAVEQDREISGFEGKLRGVFRVPGGLF